MNYNLNHDRLIFDNSPFKMRRLKFFRIFQAIFSQLVYGYNIFLAFRNQTNFDVKISCVTIVLQKYLQILFYNNGIQVINSSFIFQQTYLYRKNEIGNAISSNYVKRKNEASTSGSDNLYLLRKSEAILNFDFIVRVPLIVISTGTTIQQIQSAIEQYKKIGTTYDIQII